MGFFDRLTDLAGGREPSGPSLEEELARARALIDGKELTEALRLLETLAAREPRDTRALLLLGEQLLARGQDEDAAVAFGRAADRAPSDAEAWGRLGETLAGRRRFEPARDALRRCLALEPGPAVAFPARRALGRLYLAHGQPQRALRELSLAVEEAARVDPAAAEEPALLADRGRAALAAGDAGGADWLVRAARVQGRDVALLLEAARAKVRPEDAESLLREAAAPRARAESEVVAGAEPSATKPVDPLSTRASAALIRHLAKHGQASEALALAHELVAASPDDGEAHEALAAAASSAGQFAMAWGAAEEAARRGRPLSLRERLVLAWGAGRRAALGEVLVAAPGEPVGEASGEAPTHDPLAAQVQRWLDGTSSHEDDLALAALAPTEQGRRMVLGARALGPLPGTHTVALLNRAQELAAVSLSARAPLASLASLAAHAREAFDRPLCIAVMGEFNAGKSTFVNALVGADIAPVGVTPTTATLNVFRHGNPGGRAIYLDGRVEDLAGEDVAAFLAGISDASVADRDRDDADARAASLARTEIFAPVDVLRAVEIVDTPGLNALRPVHERLARGFLEEADALVWLFAVDQAAKASEREVLASAHAALKKILGVVSKVDRADPGELEAVLAHVNKAFGPWLESLVPVSAKQARKAQKDTADEAAASLQASGLPRVLQELERAFLGQARSLKAATALGALDRFAEDAAARLLETESCMPDPVRHRAEEQQLESYIEAWLGALATERVTLRARLDEIWRNGALELATLIEPRAWGLGENRARAGDEAFLDETLEEGLGRALAATCQALAEATVAMPAAAPPTAGAASAGAASVGAPTAGAPSSGAPPAPASGPTFERLRAEARCLVAVHVARFDAYARGVRESGLSAFFRHELPKLRPQAPAFRNALSRTVPEVEAAFFAPLHREFLQAAESSRAALREEARAAELERVSYAVLLREPFEAFRAALAQEVGKSRASDENAASA